MKKQSTLLFLLFSLFLFACSPTYYYQIVKVTPVNEASKDNALVFDDNSCTITYNLWANGGNSGFIMYNKTESNLYVDLGESFYILNGQAYDYYKERVYSTSKTVGVDNTTTTVSGASWLSNNSDGSSYVTSSGRKSSRGIKVTSGKSESYSEQRVICIPPKTSKYIGEYAIYSSLIRDCDVLRCPTRKQIQPKAYSRENSPVVFSNKIAYKVGDSTHYKIVDNSFYVSEICNYPEWSAMELKHKTYCGDKSLNKYKQIKYAAFDSYYIRYTRTDNLWKH
jgi:hypothetical protein